MIVLIYFHKYNLITIFRVFDYGYVHARQNSIKNKDSYILKFPEPKIIYLYYERTIPDEYILTLDFGSQGTFDYKVSTFKFLDISIDELNQKKMVILIPFALLKLRKILKQERTPENLTALKKLIQNDIIGSIDVNEQAGNITCDDARKLKRQTLKLYEHIYSHYDELKELNTMTDETFMLDIDIIEKEHELALNAKDKIIAEKDAQIALLEKQLKELQQK